MMYKINNEQHNNMPSLVPLPDVISDETGVDFWSENRFISSTIVERNRH